MTQEPIKYNFKKFNVEILQKKIYQQTTISIINTLQSIYKHLDVQLYVGLSIIQHIIDE